MRNIAIALATSLLLGALNLSAGHHETVEAKKMGSSVTGLVFYADWCGNCKKLDPRLKALEAEWKEMPASIQVLNLTDKDTRAAAREKAAQLGVEKLFDQHARKTGFMLLVDSESGKVLARVTSSDRKDEIREKITKAAAMVSQA